MKKIRFNVDVPLQVRDQIRELQKRSGAATLGEVFRRSLSVYDCFTDFQSKGWELVFRHPELGEKTLKLL